MSSQPVALGITYAVLGLGGSTVITLVLVLNRDSLLAVDRLARDSVDGSEQIFLTTASDEDPLVTMGLDNNLLAALGTAGSTTAAAKSGR
jgi:hypothetical protein